MEEDDGIHLCRGIRYALTMHLFSIAEAAVRDATARAQHVQAATAVPNGAAGTPIYWSPDPASRETIADKGVTYPLDGNLLVMFAMHRTMQSMNGACALSARPGTNPEQRPHAGRRRNDRCRSHPQTLAPRPTARSGRVWASMKTGCRAAIFHVHAPHVSGVLDTIDHAIRADRAGAVYAIVAACVPEDDHDLARLFADNLDTLASDRL